MPLIRCIMGSPIMSGSNGQTGLGSHACFVTTQWGMVLAAGHPDSPQAAAALEQLCRSYWYPLYAYVRRRGYGPDDAEDLTQDFFAQLLRKNYPGRADPVRGRFRTFLLHALEQCLLDQRDRARALKRGGGQVFVSLDAEPPEERYRLEVVDDLTPEVLFERRWAQTVLERAVERLRAEFVAQGKEAHYDILGQFQPGEQKTISYAEAASRLGVSESAVKSMIHRMRQRHRELLREEVAQTVPTVTDIDDELRHLVSVLRGTER